MKKIFQILLALLLLTSWSLPASSALAAPRNEKEDLSFVRLGLESDLVLHGPYDSGNIRFDLPATWQLQPGAELAIEVKSVVTGNESVLQSTFSGAILEVYFNDRLQQSISLLSNQDTTYYVPLAAEALVSPNLGGWHELSFYLYSEFDCTLDFHKTTVSISSDSLASFPYELSTLSLDLRRLPWPIYLQHAGSLDPVSVVIPSAPTADELQSALAVTGALGRMTDGNMPLSVITTDQITDDVLATSHLLLVGKPSAFSRFGELAFPVPLVNGLFSLPELQEEDGVLQILPSPWNNARAILMISGNTDAAVVKAGQALSTLNLQTGITPDYSIISNVSPAPAVGVTGNDSSAPLSSDFRLADLGYAPVTATGMGTNWIDYEFTIPLGLVPAEIPYLDLGFSISSLVDPARSEGIVLLNDVQIASVPLTAESTNLITTRINFPLSVLRSGTNNLSVVFNLLPYDECTVVAFDSLWATIYADSLFHMPLVPVPDSSFILQDLKAYPYPFAMDPSLSSTAFILSKQDPASWLQASRVAYDLGARVAGSVLGFEAAFDGEIPDEFRGMNLILVGEPKNLSILSELKDAMPAHFESGSNIAVLDSQQVIYRIPDQKSLGYLQLFSSPWSDQRAISGIFGTNQAGLTSAIDALLNGDTRDTFSGDFVTLDGSQSHIVDTRTGTGMGNIVIALNPTISQNEQVQPGTVSPVQTSFDKSKQLILMGAILVLGLMAITAVLALWFRKRLQ